MLSGMAQSDRPYITSYKQFVVKKCLSHIVSKTLLTINNKN